MDALNAGLRYSTSSHGMHQGMPLVDQYLMANMSFIPPAIRDKPGSKEFRSVLRALANRTGLLPTRRETLTAWRRLSDRGLVPIPRR